MKTFLLPCSCSHAIVITTGQAGGRVTCPACGRAVDVPKLRDFATLQATEAGQSGGRGRWRLSHACMLAGGVTAVAAWLAAAVLGRPPASTFNADTIRANVAAASDRQIYEAWKQLSQSGVARLPLPDEKRLQQTASFRQGISRGLVVIGGAGAVVAALGAALRSAHRPRPS